jgi:hypothetical protein
MSLEQTYAEVPYVADAYAESDPAAVGAVAALLGVDAVDPREARVLEIGCAVGGNLVPLAARYPGASFVGIDLSPDQIRDAEERGRRHGLRNVTWRAGDLRDLTDADGPFDYVIAHGLYSWIPEDVRAALLPTIRRLLSPRGVAYVSYDVLPGGYLRSRTRDLMTFHAERYDTLSDKVRAAREVVAFVAKFATDGPHRAALRSEFAQIEGAPDGYIAHDHLELYHRAVTYRDFVADGRRSGLVAVADARFHATALRGLPPEAAARLQEWSRDEVDLETYLDALRDRAFRQTVLVRDDAPVDRDIGPDRLDRLHLWSELVLEGSFAVDGPVRFSDADRQITTARPSLKAAVAAVSAASPGTIPATELGARAAALLGGASPELLDEVDAVALQCLGNGAMMASLAPIDAGPVVERPTVFGPARLAAAVGPRLPSLRHRTLKVSDIARQLAMRLDGTVAWRDCIDLAPLPDLERHVRALALNAYFVRD